MWKKIEQYIRDHRQSLDVESPGPELWQKIEGELGAPARTHWFTRAPYLKMAAVVMVAVGLSYLGFYQWHFGGQQTDDPAIAATTDLPAMHPEVAAELDALEAHYRLAVEARMERVEQYHWKKREFAAGFEDDLQRVEEAYAELREEIAAEGLNEYNIEALIRTYELKLRVLEELLYQLQRSHATEAGEPSSTI
jgi:hypothetical protein